MAAKKTQAAGTAQQQPKITRMEIRTVVFEIEAFDEGSILVTHQWSEKAKKEMRDKQQKKARGPRAPKDPQAEYEAARYLNENGKDCVPAIAFKKAIVDAASFSDDATKVLLRGSVFVPGEFIEIHYKEIARREDVVKIQMSSDLRYRPEYKGWSMQLPVQYDASQISLEQLVNFVARAGFSIGIGEHRPQKNGQNGRFRVSSYKESSKPSTA